MPHALLIVAFPLSLAVQDPTTCQFDKDSVSVQVAIVGSEYTYHVRNHGVSPLVRFEIGQKRTYDLEAPQQWQVRATEDSFVAWTDRREQGIMPGQTGRFSMRVSSAGAVLGESPARITLADGSQVVVNGVWSPWSIPRRSTALLAGVIVAILLAHGYVLWRRGKGTDAASELT